MANAEFDDEGNKWGSPAAIANFRRKYSEKAEAPKYKIVRSYLHAPSRVIKTGLTLEEAQAHCHDPETSSSTCTSSAGKARTRRMGAWFDGYNEEKPRRRRSRR